MVYELSYFFGNNGGTGKEPSLIKKFLTPSQANQRFHQKEV